VRYLLLLLARASDLCLIVAVTWLFFEQGVTPLTAIAALMAFSTWTHSGGFIAWQPSVIRQFFANMKRSGM
jgi:hypothetical protein